jgi:hypothetical protein
LTQRYAGRRLGRGKIPLARHTDGPAIGLPPASQPNCDGTRLGIPSLWRAKYL